MRDRFVELVERQLELFAAEHAGLLEDAQSALDAYNAASRDEAEDLYGDYVDRVDAATEALASYRDTFARTLEPDAAEEYEAAFNRRARKRVPELKLD
ncbi:MAG: hypothetical protein ACRDMY_02220 [Gaiellaceae bacterium]